MLASERAREPVPDPGQALDPEQEQARDLEPAQARDPEQEQARDPEQEQALVQDPVRCRWGPRLNWCR